MWPRRRRELDSPTLSPRDQLWSDLRDFFEDEAGYYAGGTVFFLDIAAADVRRLWEHISVRATSFGEEPRMSFRGEPVPDAPKLSEAIERLLSGGDVDCVDPILEGVKSHGELLPDLFVELCSDIFGVYWWVGHPKDDWNPTTASALARLLGDLRALVPRARLELEHSDDPNELWRPIQMYLDSQRTV